MELSKERTRERESLKQNSDIGLLETYMGEEERKKLIKILEHIQDETSIQVMTNRMLFNKTGDFSYVKKLTQSNPVLKDHTHKHIHFYQTCKDKLKEGKKLIFYGVGDWIRATVHNYQNERFFNYQIFEALPWLCFCDNDYQKQKEGFLDREVISPEMLIKHYTKECVVIGTAKYYEEVKINLIRQGMCAADILVYPFDSIDSHVFFDSNQQYFDKDIIKPLEDERFIDGGCFTCDTVHKFLQWNGGRYSKIYGFEPDKYNYSICEAEIETVPIKNMELYAAGLMERDGVENFLQLGHAGACIGSDMENAEKTQMLCLDSAVQGKVTFIKLDIEGAELSALKGAKEIIGRDHPRLAICVYHKKEDPIEIASFILNISEEYRLFYRHYSNWGIETVLYAI